MDLIDQSLVDNHCHGLTAAPMGGDAFEGYLTESRAPLPGGTWFDSPLGLAVRAICAPLLDLPAHASPADYLARRAALGEGEATRRMLAATGIGAYLVDTGLPDTLPPADLAAAAGAPAYPVLRLEQVAERLLSGGVPAAAFADRLAQTLADTPSVATKSVAAYRYGLDLDPARPTPAEVRVAAGHAMATGRVRDPVLLRHLLWAAVDLGRPIQLHTGFGDPDLTLHRADPSLLTPFIRAAQPSGVPLILLHCYPFVRSAAYLAHAFPQVYVDCGLALNHTGAAGSVAVLAEFLELAPFTKVLFSTDAYGPPELYATGAALFRTGLSRILASWVDADVCAGADAARIADLIGAGNACRVYGIPQISAMRSATDSTIREGRYG